MNIYRKPWREWLNIGARSLGIALLAGVLLAACADDDDDSDGDDLDLSSTVELTSPAGGGSAATTPAGTEATSTTAGDSTSGTSTEPEADSTATTEDASVTEEDDTSPTAGESDETATEEELNEGTPTEDAAGGTVTADDDETPTEDAAAGTATTDDSDTTATADEPGGTAIEDDEGTATDDATGSDTAELGESVEMDGFSISVDAVETFVGLPGVFEADEDNELIAVTLTIENSADADELSILRALSSMHLEDVSGDRYDIDLVATAILIFNQEGIMDTQVVPGDSVTGNVGFQIPADTQDLMLVFESDAGGSTAIDLSDELQ